MGINISHIKHLHSDGVMCLVLHAAPFVEFQQGVILTLQLIKVTLQSLQLNTTKTHKKRLW